MCPAATDLPPSSDVDGHEDKSSTTAPPSPPPCTPNDPICRAAYRHAHENLHPAILAHSLRVYTYARDISASEATAYSEPHALENTLLYVTSLFHDMGTSPRYGSDPESSTTRFEIAGADAALAFLSGPDIPDGDVLARLWGREVWLAIALHTSPQIAERSSALARLLRLGVRIDFGGEGKVRMLDDLLAMGREDGAGAGAGGAKEVIARTEREFPRDGIEKVLGDAVTDQALVHPEKAPMVSWPGVLLRSKRENTEWDGVNKAF
jgi:hypothetical protein